MEVRKRQLDWNFVGILSIPIAIASVAFAIWSTPQQPEQTDSILKLTNDELQVIHDLISAHPNGGGEIRKIQVIQNGADEHRFRNILSRIEAGDVVATLVEENGWTLFAIQRRFGVLRIVDTATYTFNSFPAMFGVEDEVHIEDKGK